MNRAWGGHGRRAGETVGSGGDSGEPKRAVVTQRPLIVARWNMWHVSVAGSSDFSQEARDLGF